MNHNHIGKSKQVYPSRDTVLTTGTLSQDTAHCIQGTINNTRWRRGGVGKTKAHFPIKTISQIWVDVNSMIHGITKLANDTRRNNKISWKNSGV